MLKSSQEELSTTLQGYVAYFGTYTVDPARGVVVHHVIADVRREYTGTDQVRPFRLTADELQIGDGKTWLRSESGNDAGCWGNYPSPLSNAARSHPPASAAATYVDWQKRRRASSGSGDWRTAS
jgi:hypothetical protein